MPYDIELMAIGADIYPLLRRSADALNRVQTEFHFHLTPLSQRPDGLTLEQHAYRTAELFSFLRDHRLRFGGHRPFIIAFVAAPLEGTQWRNIFGAHEGREGLAVVTTYGSSQYVKEEARYCSYYLLRYALSFVNPTIKAHNEGGSSKDCYFHFKQDKRDIRVSMDSGNICDVCSGKLNNPDVDGGAHRLSDGERAALKRMRSVISGDLPRAIVMKGGGVKGLAFAGALLELEKYFWFDQHVGTSAGAIAAALLAADYTPTELRNIFSEKDFLDFLDTPFWKAPFNLLFHLGLYPGEAFRLWMKGLIAAKRSKVGEITMADLNGATVYAATRDRGTIPFASSGPRSEAYAAFAVRCSMSIPLFFFPMSVDNRRVFDGGLRNNFPLKRFIDDNPLSEFIGLYLVPPKSVRRTSLLSDLLGIVIEGEEREAVDKYIDRIVVIDTSPVGTIDFRLSAEEKDFLLKVGKAAALQFIAARNLDEGPDQETVASAIAEADASRRLVLRMRVQRTHRRNMRLASLAAISSIFLAGAAY